MSKNLLIVDMQKGFITEQNEFLIKNIENLLKNNTFDNIFATKFINTKKSPFVRFLNWNKLFDRGGQAIALSLPKHTKILRKTSYGLKQKDIQTILSCCGDEIMICGTDYDSCVLAIAFQLFDNGIKPIIVKDCIGSHSTALKKAQCLKIFEKNFGK